MKKFGIIISLLLFSLAVKSQQNEFYFRFIEPNKAIINGKITNIISIDNVVHDTVYAYANDDQLRQFDKLGYKYTILPKPSTLSAKSITMATTVVEMANWDRYPTYSVYRAMMKKFAQDYPTLCKLDSIGTTPNNHKIYVVKLSKNVTVEEPEVEVFYTSSMHGDEITGYVLMLRLIDYFLSNYETDAHIASMLNTMAIYINPSANPDGTYYGGDNTVSGAIRANKNGVDINRNFPDPITGTGTLQPETQIMMNYASSRHFTLSANFHGGEEVVNYPWDTWTSSERVHPDNNWFYHFSRQYADSAHAHSPLGYMSGFDNGITFGGDWYVVHGGRQDYMNWWHHCKEITIEISNYYTPPSNLLPNYWNYNKVSLINYLESARQGFHGIVTDIVGNPLKAKVYISGHDADSSHVYSSTSTGFYAHPIQPGTWDVTYSSPGYVSQTHSITVTDWASSVEKNIVLIPYYSATFDVKYQNTSLENAHVNFNGIEKLTSSDGKVVYINTPQGDNYSYSISLSGFHSVTGQIDITGNKTYLVNLVPDTTTVFSVSFDINHASTPISNSTVIFDGVEQQTSTTGLVAFTTIPMGNNYNYSINKTGYHSINAQADISKDSIISIDLLPLTYPVTFTVKHLGVAIPDANINFNGIDLQTDSNGTISFSDVNYGTGYSYTVSKLGYQSVIGQIDVLEEKSVDIELIPLFTVLFDVKNQGNPVDNADVSFNSINQQTALDGTSSFSNVLYGTGYNYSVSKTGYYTETGQIDVTEDKTINIELTSLGIIVPEENKNHLKIWPNPFSNNFNIRFNLDKPSAVNLSVYSMDGRLITSTAYGKRNEGLNVINVTKLPGNLETGNYIIVLKTDEKSFSQIIQHIR
jgi:hypothetical protein